MSERDRDRRTPQVAPSPDRPGVEPAQAPWQRALFHVIFESDTPAGKAFDIALLIAIVISVISVMLESMADVHARFGRQLLMLEWTLTILFTVEYVLRTACVRYPRRYVTSFFGVVDLLAVIPTYLSLFIGGAQALIVIRALRLLRVFRVLKLGPYLAEAEGLLVALRATRAKITVFLVVVMTLILIMGSLMYLIEGPDHGFTSIPRSVYWAIITMTTVGYGDLAPMTALGQAVASLAMIVGYSIIIVPTGIFSVEVITARKRRPFDKPCPRCRRRGHDSDASFCKFCGNEL